MRFTSVSVSQGVKILEKQEENLRELLRLRASHRSRPRIEEEILPAVTEESSCGTSPEKLRGNWQITISGDATYRVEWEER